MIVTKMAIPRRTVLRGLGTSLALPLLDAMVPSMTALANTAAKPVKRLSVTYVAHGAAPGYFIPASEGAGYELTPILKPLAPFRDRMLVLTGIDNDVAMARTGDPRGGHGRMAPAFMSGVHVKPTQGGDYEAGISIDQIAANAIGTATQLPSLQVSLEAVEFSGTCDSGYSCVYTNTLCWRTPTLPLPMEFNPRGVFERLFGDAGSMEPHVRQARLRMKRSILDSVQKGAARLTRSVGKSDQHLLESYFDSVRDVERRVQIAEDQSTRELPVIAQPDGVPADFGEYAHLMYDLQVLALQADLTRITTFMMAREINQRPYPEIGVAEGHHAISHHGNMTEKKEGLATINAYHVSMFTHFLTKLQGVPDGDGTLLDHTLAVYGSGQGDANLHDPHELPIVLAGGVIVRPGGGRHIRYKGAQLPDLLVTLLRTVDVQVDRVGDSKGELSLA